MLPRLAPSIKRIELGLVCLVLGLFDLLGHMCSGRLRHGTQVMQRYNITPMISVTSKHSHDMTEN